MFAQYDAESCVAQPLEFFAWPDRIPVRVAREWSLPKEVPHHSDGRCRPATRRSVGRTHRFFRHLQPIIEEERQLCEGRSSPAKTRFSDQGRTVTQDAVIKQLRTPFQKMPMFSDAQVSDDQAGQIAAYMASLASPSGVSFTLGFQQLASMIPFVVGNPLENEHSAADGSRSWINGPQGLQMRSNDDRFDWEKAQ